jgi:type IV secretion system protein VirD4
MKQDTLSFLSSLVEVTGKGFSEFGRTFYNIFLATSDERDRYAYRASLQTTESVLSRGSHGYCLNGTHNLSTKDSFMNGMIIGGTGVGKSATVLIPSLLTMRGSFVIHDPSGELHTKTAYSLLQRGYIIKTINFSDYEASVAFNPLLRIQNQSDINKVAEMLVRTSMKGGGQESFWNLQAQSIIRILITILLTQETKYRNLANVKHLLDCILAKPKELDKLFSRFADDKLFNEYAGIQAYDVKLRTSIIATCQSVLQLFTDSSVAQITSHDTLNMGEFRKQPTALFIQNNVTEQVYFSVLTSLLFEQFIKYTLQNLPSDKDLPIFFLIDEASSLTLPGLPVAIANIRKYRSGILLCYQTFNQVIQTYGKDDAETIRGNCYAKLYFTGQPQQTAEELERLVGKIEYTDAKGIKKIRPLLTSDQIRSMPIEKALLIAGHHRPIRLDMTPYYKNYVFRKATAIPLQANTGLKSHRLLELLPL